MVSAKNECQRYALPFFNLKDAHASHIQQVASPGMHDADEHIIAPGTAYDRPHPVHVGGGRTNDIGGAAARAGDLGERHFKGEDLPVIEPFDCTMSARLVSLTGSSCCPAVYSAGPVAISMGTALRRVPGTGPFPPR